MAWEIQAGDDHHVSLLGEDKSKLFFITELYYKCLHSSNFTFTIKQSSIQVEGWMREGIGLRTVRIQKPTKTAQKKGNKTLQYFILCMLTTLYLPKAAI